MGGRLFPGEHHAARFQIAERERHIDFAMRSQDGKVRVKVVADEAEALPVSSCFSSLAAASSFFEGGSLGYSVTREGNRMDGLLLRTQDWHVNALAVTSVYSSVFSDPERFPQGSIAFDHGLMMRNLPHEWHQADDLYSRSPVDSDGY